MSTDKAPLRCVLFDLDGTLLDTARISAPPSTMYW